jgi:4-amino-4-deoxy-L-arabinose transferase-like glycosyltransferase
VELVQSVVKFFDSKYQLILPFIIAGLFAILAISSIPGMAATTDEKFHFTRGIMLLKTGDYRINQHHPILFNVISAIPAFFNQDLKIPELDSKIWSEANKDRLSMELEDLNGELAGFTEVLYGPRVLMSLISAIFLVLFYFLINSRFGFTVALISTLLLATSPTFLAHARLVTTDAPAMMTILLMGIAGYDYFRADRSAVKNLIFGNKTFSYRERNLKFALFILSYFIALITKYTAVSLVVVVVGVIVYDELVNRKNWVEFIKSSLIKLSVVAISLIVLLTAAYKFQFETPKEMQYGLESKITYAYNDLNDLRNKLGMPWLADTLQYVYEEVRLPFPQYVHGFYENVINHSLFGHKSYFLGERSVMGWFWYFPVAFVIKEQLFAVVLFISSVLLGIWGIIRYKLVKGVKSAEFTAIFSPANIFFVAIPLLLTVLSLKSTLNLGVRHILPLFPFFYILVGYIGALVYGRYPRATIAVFIVGILCSIISLLSNYPYYISYFNEMITPRSERHLYLRDSNLDWRQNELRAEKYVRDNRNHYQSIAETPNEGILVIPIRELLGDSEKLSESNRWLQSQYNGGDKITVIGVYADTHIVIQLHENPYYEK